METLGMDCPVSLVTRPRTRTLFCAYTGKEKKMITKIENVKAKSWVTLNLFSDDKLSF
jgi:hypothetical protein